MDRFAMVTHVSTLISLVCCFTMAISGYWVFTDKTEGNILNNFSAVRALFLCTFITLDIKRSFRRMTP